VEAFRAAIDTLFTDPNLTETAHWKAGGIGSEVAVPVIPKAPDASDSFGDTRVVLPTVVLDVRKSDILAPAEGDLVEIGASTFKVIGTPMIDRLGMIWACEMVEL
jgi:hypothetical protein